MKTFTQLLEDLGAVAANTTGSVLPDREPVVSKKAQKLYKKKQSTVLNTVRKLKSTI